MQLAEPKLWHAPAPFGRRRAKHALGGDTDEENYRKRGGVSRAGRPVAEMGAAVRPRGATVRRCAVADTATSIPIQAAIAQQMRETLKPRGGSDANTWASR